MGWMDDKWYCIYGGRAKRAPAQPSHSSPLSPRGPRPASRSIPSPSPQSVSRQYTEVSRTCQFVDLFDWRLEDDSLDSTHSTRLTRPRIKILAPLCLPDALAKTTNKTKPNASKARNYDFMTRRECELNWSHMIPTAVERIHPILRRLTYPSDRRNPIAALQSQDKRN